MVFSSQSYDAEGLDSPLTIGSFSDADAKDGRQMADLESSGKKRTSRKQKEDVVIEAPFGITICGKHQLRAAVQALAFGALVMGSGLFYVISSSAGDGSEGRLLEEAVAECATTANTWWELLLYILGILYTFLALAIVCDEFFVPALEELSGPHRMNLSMDVAGKLKFGSRQNSGRIDPFLYHSPLPGTSWDHQILVLTQYVFVLAARPLSRNSRSIYHVLDDRRHTDGCWWICS